MGEKQILRDERRVRVFISSTFRDMKLDRDHLVKFVFPELRETCERRGVVWEEVDLRWGIPDEDSDKLLPLCFTQIARCRPYFIGLLGPTPGSATCYYRMSSGLVIF
jgi:hypothetical protein